MALLPLLALLLVGPAHGEKPNLVRVAPSMPSGISVTPTPRLPPALGHVASAAGAFASACAVFGWAMLPTALWASDARATVGLFVQLQLPMVACGILMGLMLKSQRRGGQHTSPKILWLVSRLNLVPTPLVYALLDALKLRGYYQRIPMPEEVHAEPSESAPAAPVGAPLYLGGLPLPWHIVALRAAGVRAVVNCCDEFGGWNELYESLGIEQLRVPTTDYMDVSAVHLRKAVAFIDSNRARGRGVYVHCKAGVGRAGSVAVTYIAARAEKEHRLELEQANAYVRTHRPVVVANLHSRAQVRAAVEWVDRRGGEAAAAAPGISDSDALLDRAGEAESP
jgi:atypical dual specificity phosphatase